MFVSSSSGQRRTAAIASAFVASAAGPSVFGQGWTADEKKAALKGAGGSSLVIAATAASLATEMRGPTDMIPPSFFAASAGTWMIESIDFETSMTNSRLWEKTRRP